MKFFPVLFSLSLAIAGSLFSPDFLSNKLAIAQSNTKISQANQIASTHKKLMKAAGAKYTSGDLDGAFTLYEEARQLARQQGNVLEEVEALDVEARLNNSRGQYSQAEDIYRESLLLLERNARKFITSEEIQERNLLKISLLTGLGIVYKNIGEYSKATEQLRFAVTQAQRVTIPTEFQYLYFQPRFELGFIYTQQKEYSEAIALFQEGIVLAKKIGDRGWESTFLVGLGSTYIQAGDLKRGRELMNQARKMDVYRDNPELREQNNRSFDSLDVELNRVSEIGSFLEGSVQLLQRSTRELRRTYQLVSSDSRFSVISEFADSIEEVTVQFRNLSISLKDGNLSSVAKISTGLANALTKFTSYNERLLRLMDQMQSQPDTFRRLMNTEVLPALQDVTNNLTELVDKFGGSDGNQKSLYILKKN
jgi:tetratricopeptide (TPR) repeat protein